MTIISVTERLEDADFTGNETHNELTRGYYVVTDGAETEDYEVVDALIANGDVPNAGGAYTGNSNYRARSLTCRQLTDATEWLVTVKYDNRTVEYDSASLDNREVNPSIGVNPNNIDDPKADPIVVNISDREESFPLFVDLAGRPIISTAKKGLDPLPNGHFANEVIELQVNTTSAFALRQVNGTVNKYEVLIADDQHSPSETYSCPPGTVLCKVRTSGPFIRRKSDGSSSRYWKNTLTFERRGIYLPASVFSNNVVQVYRQIAGASETWDRMDSEWSSYAQTIGGTTYYQLPWGEYLANTGYYFIETDAPTQWSSGTDYAVGDRVWHNNSGTYRYVCLAANGPSEAVGTKEPAPAGASRVYWQPYAEGQNGDAPQRIKYKHVDSDLSAENAELPVDTPQWLTSAGAIRLDDASPANPYIYLYFQTHFSVDWLSIADMPVFDPVTTTTPG